MGEEGDGTVEMPRIPEQPIPSYYRCPPPNEKYWVKYNGEAWIGSPVELKWYQVPVPWARGRAPRWAVLTVVVVSALAIAVYLAVQSFT